MAAERILQRVRLNTEDGTATYITYGVPAKGAASFVSKDTYVLSEDLWWEDLTETLDTEFPDNADA